MGSVTPWLHQCPFSTMAVLSLGMGVDQVRFLNGAPAVVKAPASAVRVTTATHAGILLVRGEPSKLCTLGSIPSTRSNDAHARCERRLQPCGSRFEYGARLLCAHCGTVRGVLSRGSEVRPLVGAPVYDVCFALGSFGRSRA